MHCVDNATGKLCGALTWGVNPNTTLHNDVLTTRLRSILRTNGQNIINDNNNNKYPLTIQQLSDGSQNIILNLLQSSLSSNNDDFQIMCNIQLQKDVTKPYCRHTASKNNIRR